MLSPLALQEAAKAGLRRVLALVGEPDGIAGLDGDGLVPAEHLPPSDGDASPLGVLSPDALSYPLVDNMYGFTYVDQGQAGEYNAFGGIELMPDGRLIYVWRKAASHQGTAGELYVSFSDTNFQNWSTPALLLSVANRDLRDAAVSVLDDGRIAVTYFASTSTSSSRIHSEGAIFSSDNGATWTAHAENWPDTFTEFCRCSGPIRDLGDGVLLWPIHGRNTGDTTNLWQTAVLKSEDNGQTWTQYTVQAHDGTGNFQELNLTPCADGTLLGVMRNNTTDQPVVKRSSDGGETWSTVATAGVTLRGSGRPALVTLSTGRIYMLNRRPSGERPIMYWSDDHGTTWAGGGSTSATAGQTVDQRFKNDGTTQVIYEYGLMVEVEPGLVAVGVCVEDGASGSSATVRWISERAAITAGGQIVGFGGTFGGRWDSKNALRIQGPSGTVTSVWEDTTDDALRYKRGQPTSDTDGTRLTRLSGSKTHNWASIANGAEASTTVSVPGAAMGDFALASMSNNLQGMKITAHVSATNTVTVVLKNDTGAAIDLASGTLRATVL